MSEQAGNPLIEKPLQSRARSRQKSGDKSTGNASIPKSVRVMASSMLVALRTGAASLRTPWHYLKHAVESGGGLTVQPDAKLKLFKDSNPLQ